MAKGRIPDSFIDDLLGRVDIVELISRRITLKKSGRNYTACCPFHDEKTPSFSVNQDKQFYYCFGCGAGGNSVSFLMDYDRLDFPAAIENLAQFAGLEVPREELSPQQQQRQARRKTIYDLMEQTAKYFQDQLRQHPQGQRAVDYLKNRGLSGQIARDFGIGYAPPGWDNLLKQLGTSEEARQQLIDSGMLIVKDDGRLYDRFRDRIMFPIRDTRGRVIAFGGRVLGDEKPKYLNSPDSDIFHKGRELYGLFEARQNNKHLERLLITEGYMDVVALAQHGIPYGIATLGTASNSDHLRTAFRYCSEIVFCFDGDEAGRRAAQRALENALPTMEDGRSVRFLFLPDGEDPDSLVRAQGSNAFQNLIHHAQPLEAYFFDAVGGHLNPESLEGRATLNKLAMPLLQKLPAGVFRELMFDKLAQRTGLSAQALDRLRESAEIEAAQAEQEEPKTERKAPRSQSETLLARLPSNRRDPCLFALAMLLYSPSHIAQQVRERHNNLREDQLPQPLTQSGALLLEALTLLNRRPESSTAMLLGHWYGQPAYTVLNEALKSIALLGNKLNDDIAGNAFQETLDHFQRQRQKQRLDLTLSDIRESSSPAEQGVDKSQTGNYAELNEMTKSQLQALMQMLDEKHRPKTDQKN
ncbi:DNA primase [Spongiibacter sp. KMU-158]|uniref:DNA primase n=1 Tax=Spongiibacter pelagi TaxID=2760804 RepID=A0A927C350_9GAMM|nr:DNA primase [Spongiibacter pelagi]MBD2858610.1 DNA primase [Spongiibacter pelagi]